MSKVIAISNHKGGVGKTSVVLNLGVGLSRAGKNICLIDADPQGSLTASLGYHEPDEIPVTLTTIMKYMVNEHEFSTDYGILHHEEGVDLLPENISLSGVEATLNTMVGREMILRDYIERIRNAYDYVLIDSMPSLGIMTINALVAADSILIPVQAAYLPIKGLQEMIHTVSLVKKRLNRNLSIMGILINMVDYRTNYAKDITEVLNKAYGDSVGILNTFIPFFVKAAEASANGSSIYWYAPKCKVAESFAALTEEVMSK